MPHRLACPRCQKVGFVRAERVIAKGQARTDYFCGHCLHAWQEPETPPERISPVTLSGDD